MARLAQHGRGNLRMQLILLVERLFQIAAQEIHATSLGQVHAMEPALECKKTGSVRQSRVTNVSIRCIPALPQPPKPPSKSATSPVAKGPKGKPKASSVMTGLSNLPTASAPRPPKALAPAPASAVSPAPKAATREVESDDE